MLKKLSIAILGLMATACLPQLKEQFKNPPEEYRPMPLWFWNNATVTAEGIDRQLQWLRDSSGYGGVSILPFGAKFEPKYLSEEYFALYGHTISKAEELGMKLSLYDEYGFPSGSGGAINGDDTPRFAERYPDLTMKRLDKIEETVTGEGTFERVLDTTGTVMAVVAMRYPNGERINLMPFVQDSLVTWEIPEGRWRVMQFVCVTDGDPNMDYLSKEAANAYITMTHEAYYNRFPKAFGKTIVQTFYDEPTLYRAKGRVWTPTFNEEFAQRFDEDPDLYYPALWYDIGEETQAVRNKMFGFRSDLYAEAYPKAIDEWSRSHGVRATGHQDNEEILNPVGTSGDLMKCFQYLEIPGIDKIGDDPTSPRPAEKFYKLISSAAYNWNNSLAMSETYGAMGNLSWEEMYTIAMDQFSKGINVFIPHAAWYDDQNVTFLPELSSRNPLYADHLYEFNTFLARMQFMLQNDDRFVTETAVLYPIHTMQGDHYFDGPLTPYQGGVLIPYLDYVDVGEILSNEVFRDYQWLHPEVLAEKCRVTSNGLKLDNSKQHNTFRNLIIPASKTISVATLEQAQRLFEKGGKVIFTGMLPTKATETGEDDRIRELMTSLLPDGLTSTNEAGGEAYFIETPNATNLTAALDSRIYPIRFETGKGLRYIHKDKKGKSVFYLVNARETGYSGTLTLRGNKRYMILNPHTGESKTVLVNKIKYNKQNYNTFYLTIPANRSVFLVEI